MHGVLLAPRVALAARSWGASVCASSSGSTGKMTCNSCSPDWF